MIRKPFQSLLVIAVTAALVSGLQAQTPKPIKPAVAPIAPMHPPPAPPAPPSSAPTGGAQGDAPICHSADFTNHWDSPRSLMSSCLNKQVQLNQEPQNYDLIAVNADGIVLRRIPRDNAGHVGRPTVRYVPWAAVAYYNMIGDFMDIVLLHE